MSLQQSSTRRNHDSSIIVLCAIEETRDIIAHWCAALPARTLVADDGYHANSILQESPNPILVTDRVLPPWPGLDVFPTLRSRNPDLRIAFVENGNVHDSILAKVTGATISLPRPLPRGGVVESLAQPPVAA